jgi:tetratricopeptide (TPR) repeat protein
MYSPNKITNLRRTTEKMIMQVNQLIARGDYVSAEQMCREALKQWRHAAGPKSEEHLLIGPLGKCLEAQHKYEPAYELYMEALPNLKGEAYDDIYTSLLYLSERMGTFNKKNDDNPWY